MKLPIISPLTYIGIGFAVTLIDLIIEKSFDPFFLVAFLLAAVIEVFARKQKKVPSLLISFFAAFAIVLFAKTNIIDFKRLSNSSLEPFIQNGAVAYYQPNFYKIKDNDLVIIKEYSGSKNLLCRVSGIRDNSYDLEIVSRKKQIETTKDNLVGKIFHIANNRPE